ncbi:gamma-glutamyltransferase [Rhizobium sp. FY34]|uniref:gamma-glutamyltransferase family protein n=1 Tax=Rhizobium sp. FY34 TaxID=2562309 RepID=UPI0010C11506|nr:gamma-glutamyltransferase [Rhizobium sp. FY34]
MVTSPHPLATQAGLAVLRSGGNAIEAAIATAAALCVTMPHFCGLGGDAVWLVADREGRRSCFLGIGQAAQNLPVFSGSVPLRGPQSTLTSACVVDSWGHALAYAKEHWDGRIAFSNLLQPAIGHASKGFAASASQAFWLDFRAKECADWPGFSENFGSVSADKPFRQPQLAYSLSMLASDGPRSFYQGRLAQRIADGLQTVGSPLTAEDLAATRTREVDPISIHYRDLTLLAPPAPTQGASTLSIMGILNHFNLAALQAGDAARYHLLVEAVKQAFLDRGQIADPDWASQDLDNLLDPERLAGKAAAIDPGHALAWPVTYQHGDTVFFAVTDKEGRSASVLQSTYFDWGSGVMVGDTGILWQNRGAAFSTDANHPNGLAPGKRPFYTLNPGMALKDGHPHLLYGTQGADGQPQTLAVLLTGLIDLDLSPQEALAQPRFLLGRTFSDSRDSLKLEGSLGGEAMARLQTLGHEVAELPALSPLFGQAGVIRIDTDGTITGAHDPRGEGLAGIVGNV